MLEKIMPFIAVGLVVFGILRIFTEDYGRALLDFGIAGAIVWTLRKEKK